VGTYAGALGAAAEGKFGVEVVGNGGRDREGVAILDGMKQLANEGKMDDGDEFLTLAAEHKEVHKCKI